MKENLKRIMRKEVNLFGEKFPLGDLLLISAGLMIASIACGIDF